MNNPNTMEATIEIPQIPNARAFIIVVLVLLPTSWIALLMRCWTRLKIIRMWGWDDTTILASTVRHCVYRLDPTEL